MPIKGTAFKRSRGFLLALAAICAIAPGVRAAELKIAVIDPASGPFAALSINWLRSLQLAAEQVNREKLAGDTTLALTPFDNKGSVQESLVLLKRVIDQGYRYVIHGGNSAVGAALLDAINKHNERNPGKELLLINHLDADPEFTNGKCSFWHFLFEANADMKTEALASYMTTRKDIRRVYIIGQNYSFGQAISKATKSALKRRRPDIEIVGDDLHPMLQVKDFSPYVAKIKASGADSVVTANFGPDLALLVRAAADAGLRVNFFTYYANSVGAPTAIGAAGADRVKNVTHYSPNNPGFVGSAFVETLKKKYHEDFYILNTHTSVLMLADAIRRARSTEPIKVAYALEGARFKSFGGDVEMRKTDHQAQQPQYVTVWTKVNGKDVKYDQENTGLGWKIEEKVDSFVGALPTSCQMKRPAPI